MSRSRAANWRRLPLKFWVLFSAVFAGCLEATSTECPSGVVCPADTFCLPPGSAIPCGDLVCQDKPEGGVCTISAQEGRCESDVCVFPSPAPCGNGIQDPGEVCEDGNTEDGDGCSADCLSDESCGNGIVDIAAGETCEDGNDNPADGCDACTLTEWKATVPIPGESANALETALLGVAGITFDNRGRVIFAEPGAHQVRRIDPETGMVTLVGTGVEGDGGDGDLATSAELSRPQGVAVDGLGNLFIADTGNHRIRRVDALTGIISTVAGRDAGYSGDNGAATLAQLREPTDLVVDGFGNLFIADAGNHRVRYVDAGTAAITTLAGSTNPGFSGDGNPATMAQLRDPVGIALNSEGHLFIADSANHRIRRVDSGTGVITTIVGTDQPGGGGDGGLANSAELSIPRGIAFDADDHMFISEGLGTFGGQRVRRVDQVTNIISTVAGRFGEPGRTGDGGPATNARLSGPTFVAVDGSGDLYIADHGNRRIRLVESSSGVISRFAGVEGLSADGDGGKATSALLVRPRGIALDSEGHLLIAESEANRIRQVDLGTGIIFTLAGTGAPGRSGDGGSASGALLDYPSGLSVDREGHVFFADHDNSRIRRIDGSENRIITTVAGTGVRGGDGDGGPAALAELHFPSDVAVDVFGNLFIADVNNGRIRRVDGNTKLMSTAVGTGASGGGGDGGLATNAQVRAPQGLAVGLIGQLVHRGYIQPSNPSGRRGNQHHHHAGEYRHDEPRVRRTAGGGRRYPRQPPYC